MNFFIAGACRSLCSDLPRCTARDRSKAKFYRMIRKGVVVNPGMTLKHLIYVGDLCRAFAHALQKRNIEGEIFIIADRTAIPLRELIGLAAKGLGVPSPRYRLPALPLTLLFGLVESGFNAVRMKPPVFKRSIFLYEIRGLRRQQGKG